MRRAAAIRQYVTDKAQKDAANRALRVLEMAVGAALPDAKETQRAGTPLTHESRDIHYKDRQRFRSLAEHADIILPALEEVPSSSRRQLLERVERARRESEGGFTVARECCTTKDLHALVARVEAGEVAPFGTILADPPWQYGNQGTRASNEKHYGGESVDCR